MKLPFPMGTELTGVHTKYKNQSFYRGDVKLRTDSILNNIETDLKHSNIKFHNVDIDDHCIEISSKKLYTTEEFKSFSLGVRKTLKNHFFPPKNPHAVCGGAHIHVGIKDKKLKYEICRDLIMRPYLPWVFGEPDEQGTMNVLINSGPNMEEYLLALTCGEIEPRGYNYSSERYLHALILPYKYTTDYTWLGDWDGKSSMVRCSKEYNTIEFRFFEMTETWEEQKLQLDFLIAYINYMSSFSTIPNSFRHPKFKIKLMSTEMLQKITPQQAVDSFAKMCSDIGVNFDNYLPFIKRNLYPRWKLGRMRM